MKRSIIISTLAVFISLSVVRAQPPGGQNREEQIESLRIAYITKQLELTPEEAQKFWPVYNSYTGEMRKMLQEHRMKKGDELELEEKALNLRKRYRGEFLKCVPEEKFNRFLRADRDFKDKLRRELERRQMEGRPGMGPGRPQGGGSRPF
jgi:hypothetical protein